MGRVQAGFVITLGNTTLPLGPREEFPSGDMWAGSAVFGRFFWILHSPLQQPPETDAGARFDFLG